MTEVDQPAWLGNLAGVVIGDDWRFDDPGHPEEQEQRWGVVFNPNLGEVFAVQILAPTKSGRVLLLGTLPAPGPPHWDHFVEDVIRRAQSSEVGKPLSLMYLAGVLEGLKENLLGKVPGPEWRP